MLGLRWSQRRQRVQSLASASPVISGGPALRRTAPHRRQGGRIDGAVRPAGSAVTTAQSDGGRLLESVLHHALNDDSARKELVDQAAVN